MTWKFLPHQFTLLSARCLLIASIIAAGLLHACHCTPITDNSTVCWTACSDWQPIKSKAPHYWHLVIKYPGVYDIRKLFEYHGFCVDKYVYTIFFNGVSLLIHVLSSAHYSDVIMGAIASQITSLTIVYSTVYSTADQRKHQSAASLAFVRGIHRAPGNSPHKWPVTRKMFPFDDVIMGSWGKLCVEVRT